jgi:hypothetical protein
MLKMGTLAMGIGHARIGHWARSQWAMGTLAMGTLAMEIKRSDRVFHLPYALCPMTAGAPLGPTPRPHCLPHAPCPMPHAPCPMPHYLRRINWQSEMEPCSAGRGRIYPNLTVVCADDALAQT